jgi:hypothetical protein
MCQFYSDSSRFFATNCIDQNIKQIFSEIKILIFSLIVFTVC